MNSADLVARLRDGICVKAWLHHDNLSPDLPATVELLSEAADRIEALEAWKVETMKALRQIRLQDRVTRHRGTEQQFYEDGPCGKIARRLVEKEDGR